MFQYASDGPIGRLMIDRPDRRNAIPFDGWAVLRAAIAEVAAARPRALIVQSLAEGVFCAGADLGYLAGLADDVAGRAAFRLAMREAFDALAGLPMPVIAAVDGGCFGAGVALMLACDVVLAGESARFAIPPAKLGITYPQQDVARLVARTGRAQAARLLLGLDAVDGAEAARIGLVERVVPVALVEAERMAGAMAATSPASLTALKRMIARADGPADAASDALFDDSFGSADFREGIAAYHARRAPVFGS
ncbi:Enoyl-CoA hydratase/carnithine racemase [Sphingomonas laterariae]|uniref:Enoyl-CoA hydratase/carnithine racemase n=1 Tax=Edaphosphingomonas laterariae TaxID=861865 RepID=A0A239H785_9SPHN|nr:enoyl-CoA hydratase-related protein [Sphingomonas laterariae]SNS76673.1 Enoyl-CoA hydratase/carnithine racemase [Sphingomonas laterariae]